MLYELTSNIGYWGEPQWPTEPVSGDVAREVFEAWLNWASMCEGDATSHIDEAFAAYADAELAAFDERLAQGVSPYGQMPSSPGWIEVRPVGAQYEVWVTYTQHPYCAPGPYRVGVALTREGAEWLADTRRTPGATVEIRSL